MSQHRRPLLNKFIEYVVRPPALLLFGTIAVIYKVLFGWWLGPWMARSAEKNFENEIRLSAPTLFAEHGGKFMPNRNTSSQDSEYVTILAEGMLFQFSNWRGELTVQVAPEANPVEIHELMALVKNSSVKPHPQQPVEFFTLGQFDRFLDAHFETIRDEMRSRSKPKSECVTSSQG